MHISQNTERVFSPKAASVIITEAAQRVEKFLGLCSKPHSRYFFEKKHLENPPKRFQNIDTFVAFCSTIEAETTFIDRLKPPP